MRRYFLRKGLVAMKESEIGRIEMMGCVGFEVVVGCGRECLRSSTPGRVFLANGEDRVPL